MPQRPEAVGDVRDQVRPGRHVGTASLGPDLGDRSRDKAIRLQELLVLLGGQEFRGPSGRAYRIAYRAPSFLASANTSFAVSIASRISGTPT